MKKNILLKKFPFVKFMKEKFNNPIINIKLRNQFYTI